MQQLVIGGGGDRTTVKYANFEDEMIGMQATSTSEGHPIQESNTQYATPS